MMNNKRGESTLLKHIIEIIMAVFVIIALFKGISLASTLIFPETKNVQATAQIDDLIFRLGYIKNDQEPYVLWMPIGWSLISYPKTSTESPNECWQENCMCICPPKKLLMLSLGYDCKKGICRTMEKEVKIKKEGILIEPKDVTLKVNDAIEITEGEKPTSEEKEITLTQNEKSEAEKLGDFLREKYPAFGEFNLGECIIQAEKDYGVPKEVTLAMALHESNDGKNKFCVENNNLFNVKGIGPAGYSRENTWECYTEQQKISAEPNIVKCGESEKCSCEWPVNEKCNDKYYCRIWSNFKKYNNKCESIRGFADMISTSSRYKGTMIYKDEPDKMINAIFISGYATDIRWVGSVTAKYDGIKGEATA